MSSPIMTKKRADILSFSFGIFGILLLTYQHTLWPNILLVLTGTLVLRQFLRGRTYDMLLTLLVIGGLYTTLAWVVNWNSLISVILTVASIYILFREFFIFKVRLGADEIDEINQEIEEEQEEEQHHDK